jgi:D-alanyl-D-alanine dipeptidase
VAFRGLLELEIAALLPPGVSDGESPRGHGELLRHGVDVRGLDEDTSLPVVGTALPAVGLALETKTSLDPIHDSAMIAYPREVRVIGISLVSFLGGLGGLGVLATGVDITPVPASSRQLVLVVTGDEAAIAGVLYRFERDSADSPWKPLGSEWPIVVGRTGLASGAGLNRESVPGLPSKKEGDGKSPAGVFALTSAFGFEEGGAALRLPYVRLTKTLECVDDPGSRHYNRLVDRSGVASPDWKSSEKMREIGEYEWGVVVAQNSEPVVPGAGSCIFLHAWSGPESPTVGCTAMPSERIEEIVRWLDAGAAPVLVQLTQEAYRALRRPWQLPEIAR